MRPLSSPHRKKLEASVLAARRAAEGASRQAIEALGVFLERRPEHLDANQAAMRNGLRAKWRQLGGDRELLVAECAYEQWHRLLFARFLAENELLLHPSFKAPVTLADCEDLAAELGEPDAWSVAARFAAEILPGIFRLDDPCVRLRLAPEWRQALEQILDAIPAETFAADDALGWVYQFWQKDKKDEVNASERKIGGADLGPVTQLFTENYMVRFLLENSLGAWWAVHHPESPLIKNFEYLRLGDDGIPAAGAFGGWPNRVAQVTALDPCCGSGHFLIETFSMLWQMRAEEDDLAPADAQDAVLRDNLFGLELDPRCVQIAMFNVALQAWKTGGGWRQLPIPNIACSGIPVKAPAQEWVALAGGDVRLEDSLRRLHALFEEADSLGSLIHPPRAAEAYPSALQRTLGEVTWDDVASLVETALRHERPDSSTAVFGSSVIGLAQVADLLSRQYTLLITNPPYLPRSKHGLSLLQVGDVDFPLSRNDLATMFVERLELLTAPGGTFTLVCPQTWLYLSGQAGLRRRALSDNTWILMVRLGLEAFASISSGYVDVFLGIWTRSQPNSEHAVRVLDLQATSDRTQKQRELAVSSLGSLPQRQMLQTQDSRFTWEAQEDLPLLGEYAESFQGLKTGDNPRFSRLFWEVPSGSKGWVLAQSSPDSKTAAYSGRDQVILWQDGRGVMASEGTARIQGLGAWGKTGVGISEMGHRYSTVYIGEPFDSSIIVLIPRAQSDLDAIWNFARSEEFERRLAAINPKLGVSTASPLKVPIEIEQWRARGAAMPAPPPQSHDPSEWLFTGVVWPSEAVLQVAVARLLGYRWPKQDTDDLDAFADADGIVCLPSVAGEAPAADRLQQLLAAALGDTWSPARVRDLLEQAGSKKKTVGDWLQNEFFKQHCALFGNRPFVWHVWDGLRDGFSALVNYHCLDRKMLEKLTYTYLGQDWVERQRAGVRDEVAGAEARLSSALDLQRKLELIIEGEEPFDIFVRWKDLHDQPVGWEPDVNDGVRLNVRPFVEAGVLRAPVNVHWKKDRGKNHDGTERENDTHLTLATKLDARKRAGRA